jgi:hypothetical protein
VEVEPEEHRGWFLAIVRNEKQQMELGRTGRAEGQNELLLGRLAAEVATVLASSLASTFAGAGGALPYI